MAGKIFINYRRGDDPGFAQALFARLEHAFQPGQLFMDVDNIDPGLDFVHVLKEQVAECDVLISVIGNDWIGARDEAGVRRLDNPADFVRIEIESALTQGKRVIPVLVGQALMPSADELPEGMKPLARRNAVRLTHERFRADTQGLIAALQRALQGAEDARRDAAAEAQARERKEPGRRQGEAEAERGKAGGAAAQADVSAERPTPPAQPPHRSRRFLLIGSVLGVVVVLAATGIWVARMIAPPKVTVAALTLEQERALRPKDTFQECANCPRMTVMPTGSFTMGSPDSEVGRFEHEGPQRNVTIGKPFAVGQSELTFEEWDACAADGGCNNRRPDDHGWGRGTRPVINVSWEDANAYIAWLTKKTGKPYRLLTEAEYEYAARAGSQTAYPWGDSVGVNHANCDGCGGLSGSGTMPVASFVRNRFGLYDMVGNVWEWTEDCYHYGYNGAPVDGSAWITGDCSARVLRGGAWGSAPRGIRSASRGRDKSDLAAATFGFRVARSLLTSE